MKTLLLTSDFPPMVSGIARACYNFWKYLPDDRVIILAPKLKGYYKFDKELKIKVYRYFPPFTGISLFDRLARFLVIFINIIYLLFKEKVSLIHAAQPVILGYIARIIKKLFKIPYIIYVYGGEVDKFKNSKIFALFISNIKEADYIITNSDYTKREIESFIKENKIVRIYPGVDTEVFNKIDNLKKIENKKVELGLTGNYVLLTVARLVKRKGHEKVLEVIASLKDEIKNIKYVIVGNGPELDKLRDMVSRMSLNDRVIFLGEVKEEDLVLFYNLCDVFIMLNLKVYEEEVVEGFGISFIEANSCYKPVIGGNVGGSVEAIIDGKTGFIVNPYDIESVKEKLKLLLLNKEIRERMGYYGRKRAVREFDWKVLSKCFLKFITG